MNRRAVVPLLLALGASCGNGPAATTFTQLRPVLSMSCTISSVCHQAMGKMSGLDLETDPYRALVNAPTMANTLPTGATVRMMYPKLVVPGKPDQSFLWVKINMSVSKDPTLGDRMPQLNAKLDPPTLDAFKSWITSGAKND